MTDITPTRERLANALEYPFAQAPETERNASKSQRRVLGPHAIADGTGSHQHPGTGGGW